MTGRRRRWPFFRHTADDNPLKILFFREENGTFSLYSTIESGGSSIDSVSFRDFNGDGRLEVAVGWRVSTEVQTVAVYELVPNQVNVLMQSGYLRYVVDDLDSDGWFDLLLIRSEAEGGLPGRALCVAGWGDARGRHLPAALHTGGAEQRKHCVRQAGQPKDGGLCHRRECGKTRP